MEITIPLSPSIMEKIYKLTDPRDNAIKYIGYTKRVLRKRLAAHIRDSINNNKTYKQKWIRSLLSEGLLPIISIVKYIPKGESWQGYEIKYIKQYFDKGHKLTNGTSGGDGTKLSTEKYREMGLKHKGFKMTEESKQKMRLAKLGKTGKDCPNSKGLIAYNDKEEIFFWSAQEAENYIKSLGLKASKKNISACLRGNKSHGGKRIRKHVAGFKFRFLNKSEKKKYNLK